MSADFYDVEDPAHDQLQKDFLAIVDAPQNEIDSYQRAADRLTHHEESGVQLASFANFISIQKNSLFENFSDYSVSSLLDKNRITPRHLILSDEVSIVTDRMLITQATPVAEDRGGSIGYSLFYRCAWLFLLLISMLWTGVIGATLAGADLVGPVTAASGLIGVLGLSATLFAAGRRTHRGRG